MNYVLHLVVIIFINFVLTIQYVRVLNSISNHCTELGYEIVKHLKHWKKANNWCGYVKDCTVFWWPKLLVCICRIFVLSFHRYQPLRSSTIHTRTADGWCSLYCTALLYCLFVPGGFTNCDLLTYVDYLLLFHCHVPICMYTVSRKKAPRPTFMFALTYHLLWIDCCIHGWSVEEAGIKIHPPNKIVKSVATVAYLANISNVQIFTHIIRSDVHISRCK